MHHWPSRTPVALTLLVLAIVSLLTGCAGGPMGRSAAPTPVPTKTLRPTFTHTPQKPPATPIVAPQGVATSALAQPAGTRPQGQPATAAPPPTVAPSPTPLPPTPVPPSPTPERATLTVTDPTVNVRAGPGTAYAKIGEAQRGQTFEITGKSPAGDWWEINFSGRRGWIIGQFVTVNAAARNVPVAANIPPAPPTSPPRPTSPPPPPQPTQPPAPVYQFVAAGSPSWPNTNDRLTVHCRTARDIGAGSGPAATLVVTGPASAPPKPFGTTLHTANTGMDQTMQYVYNENCKIEISPFVPGTYTGILVDGSGKQISEPISFTASGDRREFLLIWKPR